MIETTKYFYNKETHVGLAEEANELAARKGVQVSRWVNNSKGRQIVTYKIHTGERNDFGSKQENVQFETHVDAGRGNQVRDEKAMLQAVIDFLSSIEEPQEEQEVTEFYYCDFEEYAGEPQFERTLEDAYAGHRESFGDYAESDFDEFSSHWELITANEIANGYYPYDGERFRRNLSIELKYCYDPIIKNFIETELAKYNA